MNVLGAGHEVFFGKRKAIERMVIIESHDCGTPTSNAANNDSLTASILRQFMRIFALIATPIDPLRRLSS